MAIFLEDGKFPHGSNVECGRSPDHRPIEMILNIRENERAFGMDVYRRMAVVESQKKCSLKSNVWIEFGYHYSQCCRRPNHSIVFVSCSTMTELCLYYYWTRYS
ncbi:hypothetical protein M378DRAFT_228525 [Amanita muscaria Koide BX008]|uniref:Uncharacterized protein n=1 Tax=Amanita muscaria (strain Koide BX008) TaxID=946122 RepID=A0A0C2XPN8_AMAMK|nr:hypothetical protein M378DRAFT_228525 [Amanita muscaria Koide BX008]